MGNQVQQLAKSVLVQQFAEIEIGKDNLLKIKVRCCKKVTQYDLVQKMLRNTYLTFDSLQKKVTFYDNLQKMIL